MKKITAIVLAITFLAACSKNADDISIATQTDKTGARDMQTRPFEISITTTADTNPDILPTACSGDLPGFAIGSLFIQGTATHIGQIDGAQSRLDHVSCDLSFATALLTTSISGQIAAANGDLIYYTGDDEINVYNLLTGSGPTGTITGVWTITGGTGRFDGASGSFTINGTVDFTTSTFSGTGVGTITY